MPSDHCTREVCLCGAVVMTCRCPRPKTDVVVCASCPSCSGRLATFTAESEIADQVASTASIVVTAAARPGAEVTPSLLVSLRAQAADLSLPDLFPIESVLVTTGDNLNDDWFFRDETYSARHTPDDKPFNLEHKSGEVIGHMTASRLAALDGSPLSAEAEPTADFHVVNSAVLYRHWPGYPDKQASMDGIIAELSAADQAAWFVSMECRFRGFDYVLVPTEGGALARASAKAVERNESTAFLTKHLRAYGGNGAYQGYRVFRGLRNITFSGVGLVRRPANPNSVILSVGKISEVLTTSGYVPSKESLTDMTTEELLKKIEDLTAAKTAAESERNATKSQLDEADKVIAALKERAEKAESLVKAETDRVAALEAEKKFTLRVIAAKEAYGFKTDDEATKATESLKDLNDAAFEAHLKTIAAYKAQFAQASAPPAPKAKDEEAAVVVAGTPAKDQSALAAEVSGWKKKTK